MTDEPSVPDRELEDLLVLALERWERDGPEAVERLLEENPARASRVRSYLSRVHRLGLVRNEEAPRHPERLGEFRILSALGQGGMGIVYRAVQESLGREVALKLVRPDLLFFAGARERFQREVELVARLQHPGIVPVYAVGNAEGVPYYAMELVRGATLAEFLEAHQGREPKSLSGADLDAFLAQRSGDVARGEPAALFRGAWADVVLRIVRELAEALEHAHRRGVLHRDVKPSNVMLTRDGRVLLLDFGLAGAEGGERTTRPGSQIGSLAYMAPEQLAGQGRELDARCDVYSLGVTAWELLTLRLPYPTSDPVKLRELAGTAARPRLETVHPRLGWDAETVLATALEPDPKLRYASAADLARDLDHLLAHRPIEAREIGPWLRLRRWSQRHPARATAASAAVLALLVGPLAWAWKEKDARARVAAERDALASANRQLEAARSQAERHLGAALEAIGHVLRSTAVDELMDVPSLQRARLAAIERGQEILAELERDRPGDRAVELESAALFTARGYVLYDQGRFEEALDSLRAAMERARDGSDSQRAATEWRNAREWAAQVLQASLRWDEAAVLQREVVEALRERLRSDPVDTEARRALSSELTDLWQSLTRSVDPRAGSELLDESYRLALALAAQEPHVADYQYVLARATASLADASSEEGDLDAAEAWAKTSEAAFRRSLELDPDPRFRRADFAHGLAWLASIGERCGQDVTPLYREAIEITRRLAGEFPEASRHRIEVPHLLDELALSLRRSDPHAAAELHREALALFESALLELPDTCQMRLMAGLAYSNWANHQINRQHDYPGGLESLQRASEIVAACRDLARSDVQLVNMLSMGTYLRALARCLSNDPEGARPDIEAYGAGAGQSPQRWRYDADLWCEWTLAQQRAGAADANVEAGRERMLTSLRRAVELGFRDLGELRKTPALASFRGDPELEEILADLERRVGDPSR